MKTKKLNQKNVTDAAVLSGGGVLGFMVSGAGAAAVPAENRKAARFGMLALGLAGAALLPSKSLATSLARSASAGIAAHSGYQLISAELQKNVQPVSADSKIFDKLKAGAVGLACPCDQPMGIRGAVNEWPRIPVETLDTTFDEGDESYAYNGERQSLLA